MADETPNNMVTSDAPESGKTELARRLERFATMRTFWSPIHEQGLEDDKMIAGEQWNEQIRKEREEEGRPMLTYNMLPSMTRQIVNKVRQERPQLRIKPVESDRQQTPDVANVQGTRDMSLADVYMGLWRNMEHISRADQAYDTAIQHGAEHGFGYFKMRARYCRHDPFVQELVLERVKNPYTIYLDPGAQDVVYADAQDAFEFVSMTKEAFTKAYPKKRLASYSNALPGMNYQGWFDANGLTVATYYWVEWTDDEVVKMNNGKVHYLSDVKDVLEEMKRDRGIHIVQENGKELRRDVQRPRVYWQKMTAVEMLTERTETVFEQIPIFPVLGEEIAVDGRIMYKSAIRDARDAQRSYNYHRTASVETVGLQPKAPYILTDKQVAGHEHEWEEANRKNPAYLSYNHIEGVTPPRRDAPPSFSAAEAQLAQLDLADMRFIVGVQEADLGISSNEKSGRAILARQQQGLVSTFTFPDNLNRAIEQAGRVFVQAVPRIYDSGRVLRVRLPDDTEDFVEINRLERTDGGEAVLVHDLAYGKYDVVIDTGPSYQAQREESVEAMLELLGVLPPQLQSLVVHLVVDNMAFPGADKVATVLRKALPEQFKSEEERAADLPKGVVFDDEGNPVYEASGEPYQPPPTPEQQTRQAEAEAEKAKQEAEQRKHQGTIATAEAKMAEAQVKLRELEAPTEPGEPDYSGLLPQIQQAITEAMEQHAVDPDAHKDAIEGAFTEAVIDVLRRVKRYVDGQTSALSTSAPAAGDDKARSSSPAPAQAPAAAPTVNVTVQDTKPDRVRIETEGDAMVATPQYDNDAD